MKASILSDPGIRRFGRIPKGCKVYPLLWSSSGIEFRIRASEADIEIDCNYRSLKPYLSVEVDGLRAQTFSPLRGTHSYNLFMNLNPKKTHCVRIIRETQPFRDDPAQYVHLLTLSSENGKLMRRPGRSGGRIEFLGDSITSGEGNRGPKRFHEWVPMVFCASDAYPRLTADLLKADYHVCSQSGWGFYCSWDANPERALPKIYDEVCALSDEGRLPYSFDFDPDIVVVALGLNDNSAINKLSALPDPATGGSFCLTDSEEGRDRLETAAGTFLRHLIRMNPHADIIWLLFAEKGVVPGCVRRACDKAKQESLPIHLLTVPVTEKKIRGGMGSRYHPGAAAHRYIAGELTRYIRSLRGEK